MWRRSIGYANDPERLFARFYHQVDTTRQPADPAGARQAELGQSARRRRARLQRRGSGWPEVGLPAAVWPAACCGALRRGQIDAVLGMGFMAHHLIQFTREALRGEQNASFYARCSTP